MLAHSSSPPIYRQKRQIRIFFCVLEARRTFCNSPGTGGMRAADVIRNITQLKEVIVIIINGVLMTLMKVLYVTRLER